MFFERTKSACIERVGNVREHAADGLARTGAQRLRRVVGAILQRRDGAIDARAHVRRHVGGAIDHARCAADRYAGQGSDITNADLLFCHEIS
ncbi:hypothetical protein D9M70_607040 [compost metagenome]